MATSSNNIQKSEPTGLMSLRWWIVGIGIVWLLNSWLPELISPYFFQIIVLAGINVILSVSLNLVNGFTGQFSMGHAGFMSVGGYLSAYITTSLIATHPELMNDPVAGAVIFAISLVMSK